MTALGTLADHVSRAALRSRRPRAGLPFVGLLGFAALHAHGQSDAAAGARHLAIVPELSVTQTYTDNSGLTSTDKRSDFITEVSPSIRIRSTAGRVQGSLDYSLSGLLYARGTESNTFQQTLNAIVRAEAVENFAFVDATANISRQNISALGTPSPDSSQQTANQTEVASVSVNPYIRGRLGGFAAYLVRLNYATTHTDDEAIGNSTNTGGSLHLGSDGAFARVNWALDASRQITEFTKGRRTQSDSGVGSLLFRPTPELQLSVRAGREVNNIVSIEREGSTTYGAGLRWAPSPRTNLSLQGDKRFFGNSYAARLEHRTAQTVWTFSDSRDISSDAAAAARGPLFTEFDLLFLQLTSKYPDPLERARQALIELLRLGKNPFAIAPGGFLSNAVMLQRTQSLSFGYLGLRTTFLISAQQGESRRLDPLSTAVDSLSDGTSIRQRSIGASVSQRLTPLSSASVSLNQSRSTDTVAGTHVDLLTLSANWSMQLGARTRVSLGARHAISDGDSSTYTESAIFASLTLQF